MGAGMMISPVILCGGSGTRLWPLSRKSYPKQFAPLLAGHTLFQQAALRLVGPDFLAPIIVTHSDFRFIAAQQLAEIGINPRAILIEPEARGTAAAILAAALHAQRLAPDALLLVAPSDHVIPDDAAFRTSALQGLHSAQAGQIVTFGIAPTRAETGYGYMELAPRAQGQSAPTRVLRFIEKPDAARARHMLDASQFAWNAGIFLFQAQVMVQAFADYAPDFLGPVGLAVAGARADLDFLRLAPAPWADAPDTSIDYAVMERAQNLVAVPFGGAWSDLGGWDAVYAQSPQDARGVAVSGGAIAIECENSLLRSEGVALVGLGLRDIIAIAMPDAVLVADMSRAQDVRQVVAALVAKGAPQAQQFPRDHRPWGWFESLSLGAGFQVKRIHVNPNSALSLQSHSHRAEHWVVVQGRARVTIGEDERDLAENQSVYIPQGQKHRLANLESAPLVLIEVQTGSYLGEDDIIRYDDNYARGGGAKG
jgi:mannose-1-phosphate guanylyltransferase / mannose-6-phosphate isomerase